MIRLAGGATRILAPVESLDYFDSQQIDLPRPITPPQLWTLVMARPRPLLRIAFRIRDAISARFGVRRIGGFSGAAVGDVRVGDRLDFFLVEHSDPEALVLTERDRHLDVMICIACTGSRVTVTASVRVHNAFGRAYMVPVGVAHRIIVAGMLRRLRRAVADEGGYLPAGWRDG